MDERLRSLADQIRDQEKYEPPHAPRFPVVIDDEVQRTEAPGLLARLAQIAERCPDAYVVPGPSSIEYTVRFSYRLCASRTRRHRVARLNRSGKVLEVWTHHHTRDPDPEFDGTEYIKSEEPGA